MHGEHNVKKRQIFFQTALNQSVPAGNFICCQFSHHTSIRYHNRQNFGHTVIVTRHWCLTAALPIFCWSSIIFTSVVQSYTVYYFFLQLHLHKPHWGLNEFPLLISLVCKRTRWSPKVFNSLPSYIQNLFFTKKYKFRSTVKDYLLTNSYYSEEYFNSNSI